MTEISISNRKLVDFAIAGRFVITRFNCNKIDPVLKCILLQDCVVQVKALAGTIVLCGCAFGQETQLSQCLSPCRCFPVQMDTGKFNARVNSVMYLTPIQGVGAQNGNRGKCWPDNGHQAGICIDSIYYYFINFTITLLLFIRWKKSRG